MWFLVTAKSHDDRVFSRSFSVIRENGEASMARFLIFKSMIKRYFLLKMAMFPGNHISLPKDFDNNMYTLQIYRYHYIDLSI